MTVQTPRIKGDSAWVQVLVQEQTRFRRIPVSFFSYDYVLVRNDGEWIVTDGGHGTRL